MYTSHTLLANAIIFQWDNNALHVLFTRDATNSWRLPATSIPNGQTSLSSLRQYMYSLLGDLADGRCHYEQLYASEYVAQGQSTMTISYLYVCPGSIPHESQEFTKLFALGQLPKLTHFDQIILAYALERLRTATLTTSMIQFLLPTKFTLAELQSCFEAIEGSSVDRRNFRKKLQQLAILMPADTPATRNHNTPALFTFQNKSLRPLAVPFTLPNAPKPTNNTNQVALR